MQESEHSPGWQLEGDASSAYERYLVPYIFAPWAERLVARTGVQGGDRVLDVACGTGAVARRAAAVVGPDGHVTGVDVNAAMLRTAEQVAADAGASIAWREGDAEALPFEDDAFDAALCQQALQFMGAPERAFAEMRRVLVAGGRVGVSVFRSLAHNDAYARVADALGTHAGETAAMMMRSPFPEWTPERLRRLAADAGFTDVRVTIAIGSMRYPSAEAFLKREAASSPLAGPLGALSASQQEALVSDVRRALTDHADDEGLVFPMETHVLVARA